jgi:hypothetical protein
MPTIQHFHCSSPKQVSDSSTREKYKRTKFGGRLKSFFSSKKRRILRMNLTQILMIHSQFQICRKREFQLPEIINMKEIIKKGLKHFGKSLSQPIRLQLQRVSSFSHGKFSEIVSFCHII